MELRLLAVIPKERMAQNVTANSRQRWRMVSSVTRSSIMGWRQKHRDTSRYWAIQRWSQESIFSCRRVPSSLPG